MFYFFETYDLLNLKYYSCFINYNVTQSIYNIRTYKPICYVYILKPIMTTK